MTSDTNFTTNCSFHCNLRKQTSYSLSAGGATLYKIVDENEDNVHV